MAEKEEDAWAPLCARLALVTWFSPRSERCVSLTSLVIGSCPELEREDLYVHKPHYRRRRG